MKELNKSKKISTDFIHSNGIVKYDKNDEYYSNTLSKLLSNRIKDVMINFIQPIIVAQPNHKKEELEDLMNIDNLCIDSFIGNLRDKKSGEYDFSSYNITFSNDKNEKFNINLYCPEKNKNTWKMVVSAERDFYKTNYDYPSGSMIREIRDILKHNFFYQNVEKKLSQQNSL